MRNIIQEVKASLMFHNMKARRPADREVRRFFIRCALLNASNPSRLDQ